MFNVLTKNLESNFAESLQLYENFYNWFYCFDVHCTLHSMSFPQILNLKWNQTRVFYIPWIRRHTVNINELCLAWKIKDNILCIHICTYMGFILGNRKFVCVYVFVFMYVFVCESVWVDVCKCLRVCMRLCV